MSSKYHTARSPTCLSEFPMCLSSIRTNDAYTSVQCCGGTAECTHQRQRDVAREPVSEFRRAVWLPYAGRRLWVLVQRGREQFAARPERHTRVRRPQLRYQQLQHKRFASGKMYKPNAFKRSDIGAQASGSVGLVFLPLSSRISFVLTLWPDKENSFVAYGLTNPNGVHCKIS